MTQIRMFPSVKMEFRWISKFSTLKKSSLDEIFFDFYREGVCSPASIKIRSVKEGGKPNPKRLQLITISSPKSKTDQDIDENDLNLILEDTVDHKVTDAVDNNVDKGDASTSAKKRVPLVTLSKDDTKKRVPLMPADSANGSEKKRVPFVTLSK